MSPRLRGWGIAGLCVGLALLGVFATSQVKASKEQSELDHELDLARKAGLPTTPEEFEATLPVAKLEDNAAPVLGILGSKAVPLIKDREELAYRLTFAPDDATKKTVRDELAKQDYYLRLGDACCQKLTYRALRDYSLGAAIPLPDTSQLKNIANLFLLRARLQDAEGHPERALADISRARRLATFATSDCMMIMRVIGEGMEMSSLQTLAELTFKHRDNEQYREAFQRIAETVAVLDVRDDYRFDLVEVLSLIRLCETEQGRRQLGLTAEDSAIPPAGQALSKLQSPLVAKAKIVRGTRMKWEALAEEDGARYAAGLREMWQGMVSFPLAAKVIEPIDNDASEPGLPEILYSRRANVLKWRAAARALAGTVVPQQIKTDDLVSPYDSKPIRYAFDGHQIEISTGGGGQLMIPDVPKSLAKRG
ncbi:MAG: hypothetical protein JSS65_06230 [Armatimonadetes bacterium]|nr:hypothetical protein [Armatimonadota bacterium]